MKQRETQAAFDPLYGLLEHSGARLCTLAFFITNDWNIAIDAVARALVAGWENDELSNAPTLCTACRLVVAESIAAISPELRDSAARIGGMSTELQEWLGPLPETSAGRAPTSADVEQALLAIDGFPRVALLLTIFEGFSIEDAGRFLETNDTLVRDAQVIGLLALTRLLSCQTRMRSLWVGRN
jgi:DNA-directed RNA polymerase specialized sigma24 family protein